mmetsp:Transcript_95509/g.275157  ORF Transcript_95509/g.275157 Transcript_95509/m.275157 type:complete len:289 (-) Transcript_95509:335-1201(-)
MGQVNCCAGKSNEATGFTPRLIPPKELKAASDSIPLWQSEAERKTQAAAEESDADVHARALAELQPLALQAAIAEATVRRGTDATTQTSARVVAEVAVQATISEGRGSEEATQTEPLDESSPGLEDCPPHFDRMLPKILQSTRSRRVVEAEGCQQRFDIPQIRVIECSAQDPGEEKLAGLPGAAVGSLVVPMSRASSVRGGEDSTNYATTDNDTDDEGRRSVASLGSEPSEVHDLCVLRLPHGVQRFNLAEGVERYSLVPSAQIFKMTPRAPSPRLLQRRRRLAAAPA